MEIRGEKAALDEAVAEARQRELQELPRQLGLFDEEQTETAEHEQNGTALATRGPGRPLGSRNKRTDEAARFYIGLYGDPLRRGVSIASLPILAPGVLDELAKILKTDRFKAATWWASIYSATLPYLHQKLASLEVKPAGSIGGEPIPWAFSDEGELVEVSPAPLQEPQETA